MGKITSMEGDVTVTFTPDEIAALGLVAGMGGKQMAEMTPDHPLIMPLTRGLTKMTVASSQTWADQMDDSAVNAAMLVMDMQAELDESEDDYGN